MKVIKKGTFTQTVYKATYPACGCTFSYTNEDLKYSEIPLTEPHLVCPETKCRRHLNPIIYGQVVEEVR